MWLISFILFPNILIASGYVKSMEEVFDNDFIDYSGPSKVRVVNVPMLEPVPGSDPLWVLRLGSDDFDDLKLRLASDVEEEDFYDAVEPLIERMERKGTVPRRIHKKQSAGEPVQENDPTENRRLKTDIMKIVNKFTLSTNNEPDSYLTETDYEDTSSLALNFNGPYTSLTVKNGINQWHFFITHSPFPEWFYEEHPDFTIDGQDISVYVPEAVHTEFYKILLHTVQMFLGFPI